MRENIELKLESFWNLTSDVWICCSKCDFAFLMPLVAMVGKKADNQMTEENNLSKETKRSLLGFIGQIFKPKKDSGNRIFGFMWTLTKFCKDCKSIYVLKTDKKSIPLTDKYWEELKLNSSENISHYFDTQTIDFDLCQKDNCNCGGSLIVLSHNCPICNYKLKLSKKEIDGLPIMKAN